MRVFRTAAVIALLAAPAHAQGRVPTYGEVDKEKSSSEIESEKAAERAYKRSLSNIPAQSATVHTQDCRTYHRNEYKYRIDCISGIRTRRERGVSKSPHRIKIVNKNSTKLHSRPPLWRILFSRVRTVNGRQPRSASL